MRALQHRVRHIHAWMQQRSPRQRRLISAGLGVLVIALLAGAAIMPRITSASEMNALGNGGFEQGFRQIPGCGIVGVQWECFTNGGAANYGFYDDMWEPAVYAGKFSQLIEINTKNMAAGDNDRYAGIAQTARVVKGASYKLSLKGLIRSTNKDGDPWRYSVQVGWLEGPQGDWRDVTNWTDVGWNTYYGRENPAGFSAYETRLVPTGDVITVFVRVWKKWGVAYEELDVNLDEIALEGPTAAGQMNRESMEGMPPMGGTGGPMGEMPMGKPAGNMDAPMPPMAMDKGDKGMDYPTTYRPHIVTGENVACMGTNLVYNGSFEQGFVESPWGDVGRSWQAFTNGGAANYGFYDEQWDIVVADGDHGQLIEINSKAVYPTDADRYAGIAQQIGGLQPGRTYELTVRGELRGAGNEEDPNRFAAQWGISHDSNWKSVDEWTALDLGPIYVRTEPAPLAQYRVRFEAPAQSIFLFIRGWKKFAITNVEMDLNLDAISLRACDGQAMDQGGWMPQGQPAEMGMRPQDGPMMPQEPMGERPGTGGPAMGRPDDMGASCLYIVKPGDMLSAIAEHYGVSMAAIARANGVTDADAIYAGQKFEIPGCRDDMATAPAMESAPMQDGPMRGPEMAEAPAMMPASMSAPTMGPTLRPDAPLMPEQSGREQAMGAMPMPRGERTYVVQPGDMLTGIALDQGIDAFDLASANGIDNMNMIYVGQILVIPN